MPPCTQPHVTIVNLDVEDRSDGRFTYRRGDGRCLPFADNSFDIAYSNSVIEHVGGEQEMQALAAEIIRVAPRYYVQTPCRWFPVEPHTLIVLLHFLPNGLYRKLAPYLGLHGWLCGRRATERVIDATDLLDLARFRRLFPAARILPERFLGMTKSLIATNDGSVDPLVVFAKATRMNVNMQPSETGQLRLNLGCGAQIVDGWINVDNSIGSYIAAIPVLNWLIRRLRLFGISWSSKIAVADLRRPLPWRDSSIHCIYSSHTLEHLYWDDGKALVKECFRVLRPGGILRVVVPDLRSVIGGYAASAFPANEFVERLGCAPPRAGSKVKIMLESFQSFPHQHKCMYDEKTLLSLFSEAGFNATSKRGFDSAISGIEDVELEQRVRDAVIVEGRKPDHDAKMAI